MRSSSFGLAMAFATGLVVEGAIHIHTATNVTGRATNPLEAQLLVLSGWEKDAKAKAKTWAKHALNPTEADRFTPPPTPMTWGTISEDGTHLVCAKGYGLIHNDQVHSRLGKCYKCAHGSYAAETGANQCTVCAAGRFGTHIGMTSPCEACPAGKHQAATGMAFCREDGEVLLSTNHRPALAQGVQYSPSAVTDCCFKHCFLRFPYRTQYEHECMHGCRTWMRYSSLNWASLRWRDGLKKKCLFDCDQALGQKWHAWHAAPTTSGTCPLGCHLYSACLDVPDSSAVESIHVTRARALLMRSADADSQGRSDHA